MLLRDISISSIGVQIVVDHVQYIPSRAIRHYTEEDGLWDFFLDCVKKYLSKVDAIKDKKLVSVDVAGSTSQFSFK